METKITLAEDKILEINPEVKADMEQFFENFKEKYTVEALLKLKERMGNDEHLEEVLNHQHYAKGRRLWLEVDIEDTNASQGLISWLYSKSNITPERSGLRLFGCRLNSIIFQKPSDFSDDERRAIISLYEKVIGDHEK